MDFPKPYTLAELAGRYGLAYVGPDELVLRGINEIHKVQPGDVTFADIAKYAEKALHSAASAVILPERPAAVPDGKGVLIAPDPFAVYNQIVKDHLPYSVSFEGKAAIGPGTQVHPGCVIADDVVIGAGCIIYPNVVIYPGVRIGDGVIIHAGTVLGGDALYYKRYPDHYEKMITAGRLIIEDQVEIGALCNIDRGVSGDTVIGEGTKIDSHVHIAHGVVIGRNCLIVAHTAVGGKSVIGNDVTLLGQVGVAKETVIEDGVTVLSQSGVRGRLSAGKVYFGSPALEASEARRIFAWTRQAARK